MGEDYEGMVKNEIKRRHHKTLEEEAEEYWDRLQKMIDGEIEEEEGVDEEY